MSTIDHPQHYQHPSGVEAIDICEHLGFNLGNAYKYLARAGKKGPAAEDLRKAAWYLRREAARLPSSGFHNVNPDVVKMAKRVLTSGVTLGPMAELLLNIYDGTVTTTDCEEVAASCEREAAAAESGQ